MGSLYLSLESGFLCFTAFPDGLVPHLRPASVSFPHLNNFNYQLTPSIILEIVKWRKETGRDCKIIFTAHDYQLVCPNHMLNNPNTHQNCEKCLGGHFVNCMKGKCMRKAGLSVKIYDGLKMAVHFEETDVIGIVPQGRSTSYVDRIMQCEITDAVHLSDDENPERVTAKAIWQPEIECKLL